MSLIYIICALAISITGTALSAAGFSFAPVVFIAILIATPFLFIVDVKELRLPNKITLPLIALSVLGLLIDQIFHANRDIVLGVLISIALTAFFFIVSIFGGMGMGDVKLSLSLLLCAANLGAFFPVLAIFIAFFLAFCFLCLIFIGLPRIFTKRRFGKISCVPFGPFLLSGFWTAVILWGAGGWLNISQLI